MSAYPISFDVSYQEKHSRVTAFFRIILAIPITLFVMLYGLVTYFAVLAAWFVLLVTGKYPPALYNFVAGFIRLVGRANGYSSYLTDEYPAFNGSETSGYPVDIRVGPPKESYSHLKVLFRVIIAFPLFVYAYLIAAFGTLIALAAWVVEVVTGRLPEGIHNLLVFCLRYEIRAAGYFLLLTENYPPISDEEEPTPAGAVQ